MKIVKRFRLALFKNHLYLSLVFQPPEELLIIFRIKHRSITQAPLYH